jgi:hypothetical protein
MTISLRRSARRAVGTLPIWVPLILSLAFSFSLDGAIDRARKKA